MVELQPSKLAMRVRFPPPASGLFNEQFENSARWKGQARGRSPRLCAVTRLLEQLSRVRRRIHLRAGTKERPMRWRAISRKRIALLAAAAVAAVAVLVAAAPASANSE